MVTTRLIGLLATSFILTSCVQYTSGYKRRGIAAAAATPAATEDPATEETPAEEETTEETTEETPAEEVTEEEVAVEGTELVNTCAACHSKTRLAEKVILNKAAIPRLTAAYTGKEKLIHSGLKSSFTGKGRKLLEKKLSKIN
ncbi:MAG: hypothetical protein EOP07_08835 [Proteobacteria bacterium]|nr:MAG: hypothetical protein EOP07_08835 [Pseudomonadota bacterium]